LTGADAVDAELLKVVAGAVEGFDGAEAEGGLAADVEVDLLLGGELCA